MYDFYDVDQENLGHNTDVQIILQIITEIYRSERSAYVFVAIYDSKCLVMRISVGTYVLCALHSYRLGL
jgi:hypothetical protein